MGVVLLFGCGWGLGDPDQEHGSERGACINFTEVKFHLMTVLEKKRETN